MKKLTLDYEEPQTWLTIGISSQLPDYKLIYRINKSLNFNFERCDNLEVNLPKMKGSFSLYSYFDESNRLEIYLLANKLEGKVLFSEFKQLDYFLIMQNEQGADLMPDLKASLKTIDDLLFAQIIEIESAKNYLLLAEEFELHIDKISAYRKNI
jgi:hypothetical protein